MGREVSAFIIITTGKHAGSVLVYHHLSVYISIDNFGTLPLILIRVEEI